MTPCFVVEEKKLREIARKNIEEPEWQELLRRWWTKKYQLPRTSSYFQDATVEELIVEYLEDLFEEDKVAMYTHRDGKGRTYLKTGDPVFDQWEKDHAEGKTPDLWAGYSGTQRDRIKRAVKRNRTIEDVVIGHQPADSEFDDFRETY
jgi:hypothetical protein